MQVVELMIVREDVGSWTQAPASCPSPHLWVRWFLWEGAEVSGTGQHFSALLFIHVHWGESPPGKTILCLMVIIRTRLTF